MRGFCVVVLLLVTFLRAVDGLYFYMASGERKCFIEDIPDETTVLLHYKLISVDKTYKDLNNSDTGVHVDIHDQNKEVVLSRTYTGTGTISFTSSIPGEYLICLNANSSVWKATKYQRVTLDVKVGQQTIDYDAIARKEKLNDLEVRVLKLLDITKQIASELKYQRVREERFRKTSESTNSRVVWWAVGQLAVLVAMTVWQLRHLHNFFIQKKLV